MSETFSVLVAAEKKLDLLENRDKYGESIFTIFGKKLLLILRA